MNLFQLKFGRSKRVSLDIQRFFYHLFREISPQNEYISQVNNMIAALTRVPVSFPDGPRDNILKVKATRGSRE